MKKVIIIIGFIVSQQLNAQMHITTNLREDFIWSTSLEKWVFETEDAESSTLFDFNKELTMFKHTTASISSSYYIKSSSRDKEKNLWEYDVISDVGNKYHVVLDLNNNNIRFIGKDQYGNSFLVRHTIKRIWFDD